MWPDKKSGHPRICPVKLSFWPDIVRWPAVISSPGNSVLVFEYNHRYPKLYETYRPWPLKLTKIALNRSKTHIGERTTGSPGRDIFIENSLVFLNWSRNRHTNPYNFAVTQCLPWRSNYNTHAKVTSYISHRAWGTYGTMLWRKELTYYSLLKTETNGNKQKKLVKCCFLVCTGRLHLRKIKSLFLVQPFAQRLNIELISCIITSFCAKIELRSNFSFKTYDSLA